MNKFTYIKGSIYWGFCENCKIVENNNQVSPTEKLTQTGEIRCMNVRNKFYTTDVF